MPILKVLGDDPEKELEFELAYQATLTSAERRKMMNRESNHILKKLVESGQKKSFEIIKRR